MITFSTIYPYGGNCEVYNLTSLYEGVIQLALLPPYPNNINTQDESNKFDIDYATWIFNYEPAYNDFMNIIYKYIQGVDIVILINTLGISNYITESLEKLISERYGIVCNKVYDQLDWYDRVDVGPRNKAHIMNLDMDMENFSMYLVNKGVKEF